MKIFHRLFFILLGIFLCSSIPLISLNTSFILWPSTCEIAGFILTFIAIKEIYEKKFLIPKSFLFISRLLVLYVLLVTIITTYIRGFDFVYPLWSVIRFIQWYLIALYVFFLISEKQKRLLLQGLVVGLILNDLTSILEGLGILPMSLIVGHISNNQNSGPWVYSDLQTENFSSIGIFSFSRIASGFFMALSIPLVDGCVKNKTVRWLIILLSIFGIAFTGSRLGFFTLITIILFSRKLFSKDMALIILWIAILLSLSLLLDSKILMNPTIERLFGTGNENYASGIEERYVRQMIIFVHPEYIFWGCGLGNLGAASGLAEEGFKFYRAHGFLFTYLAEIGSVGLIFIFLTIYKFYKSFIFPNVSRGLIGAFILCALADDFFIPSAQSGFIPIIMAICLSTQITKKQIPSHFTSAYSDNVKIK